MIRWWLDAPQGVSPSPTVEAVPAVALTQGPQRGPCLPPRVPLPRSPSATCSAAVLDFAGDPLSRASFAVTAWSVTTPAASSYSQTVATGDAQSGLDFEATNDFSTQAGCNVNA